MDSEKLEQIWREVCDQVKSYNNIDPSQINAFFSRLHPQAMSEDFLMLTADNDFIKTWIERHYLDFIKQALMDLYHTAFTVALEVDITAEGANAQAPSAAPAVEQTPRAEEPAAVRSAGENPVAYEKESQIRRRTALIPDEEDTYPMSGRSSWDEPSSGDSMYGGRDERGLTRFDEADDLRNPFRDSASAFDAPTSGLTFENFVIGDSNRMAYSMAVAVAEMPGKAHLNPLFIYGKSGLGKTHLLRAIQNYVYETLPNLSVVYVDSAELLSDYMEASAAHDKEKSSYKNFKTRYEEADVLLIDDVQYLQGKKQTLDIVFQIFNKLTSQGRQVVLSADRAPKNIDIDERYKSRFNSGGTFDIQPPEIETKLGIVKSFVEEYRANEGSSSFAIPDDIQMYIAESSSSNIRELKSAVTKVIYQMTFFNQPDLSLDDVRCLLENHFSGGPSKRLTIADIQKEVETFYKVSHADLVGKKRTRNIIYARQIAIYLSRQMLDLPFNDIGKKFNRDHSTVMYSVTNVEEKMKENRELREELETLKQLIREI
ncbi:MULTISPECIES: chromosomal replication initiator protein DnaA [Gordonibacter]|uniref:Chromosomal replication initiator protein DnaA n=1 Tax=Gordonibacter faecis TaxID=3047475 RepID=A0ABT7DKB1_9ACTN|nr:MULTISPECIES: chromosomal replication initiator protein DnaA [unclassified Gordonibacter]MDJ1649963.1 chromosomal replication initiator protein DnaA [Gordonibacter sp. KGMB12511]HIW75895.1 chromosomal replication initiator protein DnaA [Candidatus Gordonibacter avicola]